MLHFLFLNTFRVELSKNNSYFTRHFYRKVDWEYDRFEAGLFAASSYASFSGDMSLIKLDLHSLLKIAFTYKKLT